MAQGQELDEFGNPVQANPYQFLPPEYDPNGDTSTVQKKVNTSQLPGGDSGSNGGVVTPPATRLPNQPSDPMADDFIRQHVLENSKRPGVNPSVINDPNYWVGRIKDTGGWQGSNAGYWTDRFMVPEGPPEGAGMAPAGGAANMPAPAQAAAAQSSPYDDQIHQQILKMLDRGNQPVTEESIRSQFAPVDAQMQRASTRAKEAAAERQAYQGTNIGGAGGPLDAEQRGIDEQLGGDEGKLMAQLMTNELQSKRDEINNAIQFAQGQDRVALQQQLALLDNEIRKQSLALQGQQIGNQNNQFYAQQAQQNNQFYDQFGLDSSLQEYIMNQTINKDLSN